MPTLEIINLNLQSGIGITEGYYQYLTGRWKYYFPHSQFQIYKAADFLNKEKADLIFITEIDRGSWRSNDEDQVRILSDTAGYSAAFFPTVKFLNMWNMGNAVLTPHSIVSKARHELPGGGERRVLGEVHLNIQGKEVVAYVTHLALRKSKRKRQLDRIKEIISQEGRPKLLAGDFNTADAEELSILGEAGLDKSATLPTFPSWKPNRCLSHIFMSKDFEIKEKQSYTQKRFSDHLPLISKLELN